MDARRFIKELKARGVYRVAALYCAAAWVLLQVSALLFPLLGLSDDSVSVVLALAALGFPVALVLAWWFDLKPEGWVDVPRQAGVKRRFLSATQAVELTVILLLVFSVGYLYLERLKPTAEISMVAAVPNDLDARPSIAVMPFVNIGEESNAGYFGDGLAEEILNLLAKLNELNVAARTSSFHFRDKSEDVRLIAQKLGVGHILEGSVRRDANLVRITTYLIDASNGFQLWSQTYDRDLHNILALQDEIAARIVENLQVILSSESAAVLVSKHQVDAAAYDYYLRGRDYLRGQRDSANQTSAVALFRRAIGIDPLFAEAHAGLCEGLLSLYESSLGSAHYREAEASCRQALELDKSAVAVYVALGNLYRNAGKYRRASVEFNRAVEINPAGVEAYLGLAEIFLARGELQRAEKYFRSAVTLQPYNWRAATSLGNFLLNADRVAEAIPYFKKITTLLPGSESALTNLGAAYYLQGDLEQAVTVWQQSVELKPTARAFSNLGSSLYFSGRYGEAAQKYEAAASLDQENFEFWGNLADAQRLSGEEGAAQALGNYERASQLAQRRLQVNAKDTLALALLSYYQASLGRTAEALKYLRQVESQQHRGMYVHYVLATVYCSLDLPDQAIAELTAAIDKGYPWQLTERDAGLAKLREFPAYRALGADI